MHVGSIVKHWLMLLLMIDNANIHLRNMILRVPTSCIFLLLIIWMYTADSQRINSDSFVIFNILNILVSFIFLIGKKYLFLLINTFVLVLINLNKDRELNIQKNETEKVEEINAFIYIISQEKVYIDNTNLVLLKGKFVKGINKRKSYDYKNTYTFKIIIPISVFSNMLLIPIISLLMPVSFLTVLFLQIPILNFLSYPFEFILLFVIDICNWFSSFSWSTFPWSKSGESFNYKAYALNAFLILSFGGIKNIYLRIVLLPTICIPLLFL